MDHQALIADQLALRERPPGKPAMYQRWRSLLFLHFACDPLEVQRLLPSGLTVDTFPDATGREMAWVGLVPFRMEGVRPPWTPEIRACSDFPETNVRTYAHRDGRNPGVWFFSLDAANGFACRVARALFKLPYYEAAMTVEDGAGIVNYQSQRRAGKIPCDIRADFGAPLPSAEPGTLDFFLVERYLLYSERNGRLYRGRVHHTPYPLRSAEVSSVDEGLVAAAGIEPRPFTHVIASLGVDVEVFPLEPA